MDFSLSFFLFLIIAVLIFYGMRPKKSRVYVLSVLSLGFCCYLSIEAAVTLFVTILVTYVFGLLIFSVKRNDNKAKKKLFYVLGVMASLASLFVHKYAFWLLCKVLGIEPLRSSLSSIVIPIGLSFYTFQIIDYFTSLYKEEVEFFKNPVYLFLYLSYFPKLISGPIEKSKGFMEQIKKLDEVKLFDEGRIEKALSCLLLGYFMKIVIADRASIFVQMLFPYPEYYGSALLIIGSLLYTLQIYTDFAGYSFIAMGVSMLFGIELMLNFDSPYLSTSITEFWRRWHISLSTWIKDHLYIPLGGNRLGLKRQYLNYIVVFLICGIWHGAAFRFIAWGLLHGVYSVMARWARAKDIKWLISGASGRIITFCEVSFAWIFFGSEYLRGALHYIMCIFKNILPNPFGGYRLFSEYYKDFLVMLLMTVVLFVFEGISYKAKKSLNEYVVTSSPLKRYILWYLLIMVILIMGVYGTKVSSADFIYMNF